MKKSLIALFAVVALTITTQSAFAGCPCNKTISPCDKKVSPCEQKLNPCEKADPCEKVDPCEANREMSCEGWLTRASLDDYFVRMNLNDSQVCEAMSAVENFKSKTKNFRNSNGECETKCDCRMYRQALKELDCDMKKIISQCQKEQYKEIKAEVKSQVKCCHKCLINPFNRCASCDECND